MIKPILQFLLASPLTMLIILLVVLASCTKQEDHCEEYKQNVSFVPVYNGSVITSITIIENICIKQVKKEN